MKSYLFRMARIRMAFNACGFLTYCDEVLVTLGDRISAINEYTRVTDPPGECPSADSCSDSPRTIRDMRDSAEDSDDEPGSHLTQWPVQVKKIIKLLLHEIQTQVPQQQYLSMKIHVMILSFLKKMFRDSNSQNGEKCC